jgi:adenylate kinase
VDIILLGAPGAGKGTQAELLLDWLPWPQVSSGALFRAAMAAGTSLGERARAFIERGELVPDDVTMGMVAERLAQPDCAEGVILDGFPRTVVQARALDEHLARLGRSVGLVAYIEVSQSTLLRRLSGRWSCGRCAAVYHEVYSPERAKGLCDACGGKLYQREDDAPEVQQRRVAVYVEQTAPLVAYYRERGLLHVVDGEPEPGVVQRDLRRAILARLAPGPQAETLSRSILAAER